MSEFLDRISKLSPQRLALLADELNERLQALERRRSVPLAIVGIGCRLPGGVHDPEGFWKLLHDGVDAVTEVPASRWSAEEFYDRDSGKPGKMATRWGGFIDNPDLFDPKFFGIAPAEAVSMDPQQRLLLEVSWEALEHAGIAPSRLAGTQCGVFVGICNGDYAQIALDAPRDTISPYLASGLSHAIAAGRISYVLGLQGPCLAVDTSCSASLAAVHLASQSLRRGECDAALAGGVNLILNPDITIALSQSRMMALDGRCKAFSESADGFVRGEGCGMIVLKRLPDALRDRNRILAVVRGSACNQDGRSSGLTAPNGPSQEAVVAAALADAGLHPDDVDVIEAHGTGTSLGDPIEAGALNAVFADRPSGSGPLSIGSVKTNLGHLESAAGIAGLIKMVLAVQHGEVPASLHLGKPNHRIEWDRLPLKVPTVTKTWNRHGEKRVGGVSSFGFSGTNVHVVVEEHLEGVQTRTLAGQPFLFPLSARTPSALKKIAARLHRHLIDHPSLSLADVAHTLHEGRSHFECRAAAVAASHSELLELLDRFQKNEAHPAMQTGQAARHSLRLAFVFGAEQLCGAGLARTLYDTVPSFRQALERCASSLTGDLERPLLSVLFPEDGARTEVRDVPSPYREAANFALQYALAELWRSCGIEPAALLGWGAGEYVAASMAGVISMEDGLRMAVARGSKNSSEFAECVRRVEWNTPRIPLILNAERNVGGTNPGDTAEHWLHPSNANVPNPSALVQLTKTGSAANLYIGGSTALERLRKSAGDPLPGKWMASWIGESLRGDREGTQQFLCAAASLYVLGCDLDLSGFYPDTANTVSLPTYPFERERYWLESANGRSRNRAAASEDASGPRPLEVTAEEWIYDLVWEPKPLPHKATAAPVVRLDDDLLQSIAVTPASPELMRVATLTESVLPIYAAYILQALQESGLVPLPKGDFTLGELSERLQIVPARRRVLARMLGMLEEDGVVEQSGDRFRFVDFRERPDADTEVQRLGVAYPECLTEMNILRRCGKKLSAVLRGEYDPMQLVFADGSIGEAERIYQDSPVCRFFNEKAATVVRAAVNRITGRPARILEIGAGTGATTGPILAALADRNIEYTFTDVSEVFLTQGRRKFSHVPSILYRLLNVESEPVGQGFDAGGYDIVIAANVLHATADLRQTVAHVRQMLAPGGVLLLVEGVSPDRWLDLTFGLTDSWWRFSDLDLRPKHPLISAGNWARILAEVGIGSARTISYVKEDGSSSQQIVLVAQVDPNDASVDRLSQKPARNWIVLADDSGVGEALQSALIAAGEPCEIVRRPRTADERAAALRAVSTRAEVIESEIVYLWGIDAAPIHSIGSLEKAVPLCSTDLVHLIQSLPGAGGNAAHLWIATCGAQGIAARGSQVTDEFSPDEKGAVQSLAWGVGRAFGLESPEQYRALIDLDPMASPAAAAAVLLEELMADDKEDQIVYRHGRRLVARLQHSALKTDLAVSASTAAGLRGDGSYLITGGLGGVGLRVARWAAGQHPGHLVLLGRTGMGGGTSPFAAERQRAIEGIQGLGIGVTVVEGDVASESDMHSLFERFGRELPPLRGIFHAATVVDAAGLGDLTDAQMAAMLRPKVQGTWLLHEFTKALPLDFFLAFSSTTSLLGAKGMAHYAAANQFVDAFAHFRRAAGLPMLSVNWGAWDVMRLVSSENQLSLVETGLLPMPSEKVFDRFGDLIASSRAQVMIANIDWSVLKPVFESRRSRPLLEKLGGTPLRRTNARVTSAPAQASLRPAIEMSAENRREFIEAFVQEQAAQVLGLRRGELPPSDTPLPDVGLDSLMAVDLRNRLQTGLGQELSSTIVFDYPTVSGMVGMLETVLWAGHGDTEDGLAASEKDEIRI